jgi:hypothetical protein
MRRLRELRDGVLLKGGERKKCVQGLLPAVRCAEEKKKKKKKQQLQEEA